MSIYQVMDTYARKLCFAGENSFLCQFKIPIFDLIFYLQREVAQNLRIEPTNSPLSGKCRMIFLVFGRGKTNHAF